MLWAVLLVCGATALVLGVEHVGQDHEYRRLLGAGETALAADQQSAAVEAFTGALTIRPDSMVAYLRRGEAYRAQGRQDEAVRDLREAARLAPDAPQPLVELGDLFDAADEPVQAASWYEKAAALLKAGDPGVLYKLALARYRTGNPAEAIAPLRTALASRETAPGYYLLGLAYRDTRHPSEGTAALEHAVHIAPALAAPREELARIYRSMGRPDDEIAQLRAIATLNDEPQRAVALALALGRHGRFNEALDALTTAARRAPDNETIQIALARVYLGRAEQTPGDRSLSAPAVRILEPLLAADAAHPDVLPLFGRALFLSGDVPRAERVLREAALAKPASLEAFGDLADAAEALSHFAEARDALIALDALDGATSTPDDRAQRAKRIGSLALRANDAPNALLYLNRAVAAHPQDASTLGLLAQARWRSGDVAGARDAIVRALELAPHTPELLQLRQALK